jgi:predicted O-methyltransferase YrrM
MKQLDDLSERSLTMLKRIILCTMLAAILISAEYIDAQGMGGTPDVKSIKNSPVPKTDAEKKVLDVLDDMDRNQRRGMMNVSPEDGRLLRLLTETTGAGHIVEIGTSNGYSGIWFCLGLLNTDGKLTTHEIDADRAALARKNFRRAGVDKMVTLVEGDAHEEVNKLKKPIDILFLDADKSGYIDYLNKLLPLVRPGGLIIAHNMVYPSPDPRYIKAITTSPDLETVFLHMHAAGIGVTLRKR